MAYSETDFGDGALVLVGTEGDVTRVRLADAPEMLILRLHSGNSGPATLVRLAQSLVEEVARLGYADELRMPAGTR